MLAGIEGGFFLTKEGYMDLVPPGTKENDLLCILSGCELPLIIRQLAGQYCFLARATFME